MRDRLLINAGHCYALFGVFFLQKFCALKLFSYIYPVTMKHKTMIISFKQQLAGKTLSEKAMSNKALKLKVARYRELEARTNDPDWYESVEHTAAEMARIERILSTCQGFV